MRHRRSRLLLVSLGGLLLALFAMGIEATQHHDGLTLELNPNEEKCFYETIAAPRSPVFMHFQGREGNTDFAAHIKDPHGQTVFYSGPEHGGERKVYFLAKQAGEFAFCLDNTVYSKSKKSVYVAIATEKPSAKKEQDPLTAKFHSAENALNALIEDQVYLRTREREHRDTAESNNMRVMVRGAVLIIFTLLMSVGQVLMLTRLFNNRRQNRGA